VPDFTAALTKRLAAVTLDDRLNIVQCDAAWAEVLARLAKCSPEAIRPGANLPALMELGFPRLARRYARAAAGETSYDRIVLSGEAGGGPRGAMSSSWDVYVFPISFGDCGGSGVVELAVRMESAIETALLDSLPDTFIILDGRGRIAGCHGRSLPDVFGPAERMIGRSIVEVAPRSAKTRLKAAFDQVMGDAPESGSGVPGVSDASGASGVPGPSRPPTAPGSMPGGAPGASPADESAVATVEFGVGLGAEARTFEARVTAFSDVGAIIIVREVTEARRAQAIQAGQSRFLELLARGGDFADVLTSLIRIIEEQTPGMSGLVLLMDPDGRHLRLGASASLPWEYVDTIEGMSIGPSAGSCGTAAYLGSRVIVENIAEDPRWAGLRDLALKYGLRSCWSEPVLDDNGNVLGTFAMYFRTVKSPTGAEIRVIEMAARLVRVALEQRRAKEEVEAAYEQLERRIEERTREIEQRRRVAEGLREILAALNSSRSLDEVLELILEQAEDFLQAEAGALYRMQPDGQSLTMAAFKGLAAAGLDAQVNVGDGVLGWAVASGRPVVVSESPDHGASSKARGAAEGSKLPHWARGKFRTVMAVPLVAKGQSTGAIALCFAKLRWFARDELELAVSFADQAALALDNAVLRERAEGAAVAAERSRLARELHDAVTQTLFSASMISDVLPRIWENNPSEGRARLEQLRKLTRGALAEMRSLLLELRPTALSDVGLADLLKQLVEAHAGRSGAEVDLKLVGECSCMLPPAVRLVFYRIAQECLSNVVKHSRATHVTVGLNCEERRHSDGFRLTASLVVRDNGVGFDVSAVTAEHMGLRIMTERAAGVGADVAVTSEPGVGTCIELTWSGPAWEG
jgi:signal transduction histidine kinase